MHRPLWVFGIVVMTLIAVTVGIGLAVRSDDGSAGAEVQITPRSVGVSVPTSTPAEMPTPEPSPTPTPFVLAPGQVVVIAENGENPVVMRADANHESLLLEIYPAGTSLTILEPSGQYTEYPVTHSSGTWYRVRSEDGLVGWIDARHISTTE